ncbi:hypothetical protein ES708_08107 [subsurface metagenome]
MIIKCFRCNKEIDTPDDSNADYIMASDTIAKEPREVLVALKHNQKTLAKRAKIITDNTVTSDTREKIPPTEDFIRNQFTDNEYDAVEIPNIEASKAFGEDLAKVVVETREKDIQKTGVICPDCHKPADFVIWGVHKEAQPSGH